MQYYNHKPVFLIPLLNPAINPAINFSLSNYYIEVPDIETPDNYIFQLHYRPLLFLSTNIFKPFNVRSGSCILINLLLEATIEANPPVAITLGSKPLS